MLIELQLYGCVSNLGYTSKMAILLGQMLEFTGRFWCVLVICSTKTHVSIFLRVDQSEFIGGVRVQVSGPKPIGSDATSCEKL